MSSNQENTSSSTTRRKYTTMRVIALAEKRRLKEEAAERGNAAKIKIEEAAERENVAQTKISENKAVPIEEDLKAPLLLTTTNTPQINKEVKAFVSQVQIRPLQEYSEADLFGEDESENSIPVKAKRGFFVFILSLTAFFLVFALKLPESWVNTVVVKLNTMIHYNCRLSCLFLYFLFK